MRQTWVGLAVLATIFTAAPAVAADWLFVSLLRQKQIVRFERIGADGKLVQRGSTPCPAEPACMALRPDGKTLYVSFRSTAELASFRIDGASGELTMTSRVFGGDDPAYLLPDRTGQFLFSAYYVADKIAVHRIHHDGRIASSPLQTIRTADKAHGFAIDSSNRFAFVPHTGANRIYQLRFDEKTGLLRGNDPPFVETPATDHPRHLALHPSDRWAYVSNEAGDSLGVFDVDRERGTLRRVQTVSTLPAGFDGTANSTARCEMTPDGRFVYVANRGHDSIAGFSIDQKTGRATALGQTPTEQTPRSFSITPDGRLMYAAGQGSGRIATFRIENDGALTRIATTESGPVSWWALCADVPE